MTDLHVWAGVLTSAGTIACFVLLFMHQTWREYVDRVLVSYEEALRHFRRHADEVVARLDTLETTRALAPAPSPASLEARLAAAQRHSAFLEKRLHEITAAADKIIAEREATCERWRAKLDAADLRRAELEKALTEARASKTP